jgi:hypothetical protein
MADDPPALEQHHCDAGANFVRNHARLGSGQDDASGELKLSNPMHFILNGTLGTGDLAFPSSFRSVESKQSHLVGMDEALKPTEKNGFTVIDVTPDKMTFTMFMWRPPQTVEEIDTMKPALIYEVPRKA